MSNKDFIQLALNILSCTQKDLATRLGVSPTQITKWKKDEHMSFDMEKKLRNILNIGERDPSFILMAGSIQEAEKWDELIHTLAESADDSAETGYITYPLHDEMDLLCWDTFHTLKQMGVEIPKSFPEDIDTKPIESYADERWDLEYEKYWETIEGNPYASLIYEIYLALNDVWGFYAAYIDPLIVDDEKLMDSPVVNVEPCLMELAACKIEVDEKLAPKFREFRFRVQQDYENWISIIKERAFRTGTPLRAELLDIVYSSKEKIGHEAEAKMLGFKSTQLHPDIYMNELLCGMRTIHQVLPAIMKKLGIEDEFKLDTSEFYIR